MEEYKQIKDFIEGKFREIQGILFDRINSIAADNAWLKEEKEKAEKRKCATAVLDVFIPFFSNVEELIMESSDNEGVQKQYKEIKRILVENLERKGIKVLDFPKGTEITEDNYGVLMTTEVSVNNREEAGRIVKTTQFGYHIPEENYIKQAYVTVGAYQEPKKTSPAQITQVFNNSSKENAENYPYAHGDEGIDSRMNSVITRPVERGDCISDKEGDVPIKNVKKDADNTVWNGAIHAYLNNTLVGVLKKFNDSQYKGNIINVEISAFNIYDNIDPAPVPLQYKCESNFWYHWEVLQEKGEIYFLIYPIKEFSKNSYRWETMEEKRRIKGTKKIKIF